jgi:probable rRNA maturation factor
MMLKRSGVKSAELSIVFLDALAMRRLNRKHLGHDRVTDVVTFNFMTVDEGRRRRRDAGRSVSVRRLRPPSSGPVCIDGEIYICPAEARRNARLYGEPFKRELLRYLAHGILHLLGFDDASGVGRKRMRALEDELLAKVNI